MKSSGSASLGSGRALLACAFVSLSACSRSAPPSRFPTADDAIARMRATYACVRGVQGESKVDYFGEQGRVRGNTLFVAMKPERLRFDVFSPFGVTLSTLTSDGKDFALLDIGGKRFWAGPATACNVGRFLRVPVPPHALVSLLAGEAPVLVHDAVATTVAWESGSYVLRLASKYDAEETIRLEPVDLDWDKPWNQQRVHVLGVTVVQQGIELYRVELGDFETSHTAKPRTDPDGIDPDVPPSGPPCDVETPRHVRIVSEASAQDVLLVHGDLVLNPPLLPGLFVQSPPAGVKLLDAQCR
ncbi:MAG TPA: hypothetical protein VHE30_16890 [Polyangiaceae bacterium]|nr:hypothetical protein [Polyangiaceae bacterium]